MSFILPVSLTIGLFSFGYVLASIKEVKPTLGGDPVIAAAGDIDCDPTSTSYNGGNGTASTCQMKATSNLIVNALAAAVLTLGDTQYETGTLSAFQQSYNPTWGELSLYLSSSWKPRILYFRCIRLLHTGAAAGSKSKELLKL